jgi:hypothetical protein
VWVWSRKIFPMNLPELRTWGRWKISVAPARAASIFRTRTKERPARPDPGPSLGQRAFVGYGIFVRGLPVEGLPTRWGACRAILRWSADGGLPDGLPPRWIHEHDHSLVVGWAGEADYRLTSAPANRVHAILGSLSEREAALGFILSVLPFALPLFGLEPLHASAVLVHDGALLLMGPAGAGKSTLAASLVNLGVGFLADDASAVDEDLRVWPGPPLMTPRAGNANGNVLGVWDDKTVVARPELHPDVVPVSGALLLRPQTGASLDILVLERREAFVGVLGNVRSPSVFRVRRRELQLGVAARIAALGVAAISYDPDRHDIGQVSQRIAEWATESK